MEGAPKQLSPQEAWAQIQMLKDTEMRKGAVDTEGFDFDTILKNLQDGKLKPEEAVLKARALAESRQDYH